jgi:rod shape-determining protein MreC
MESFLNRYRSITILLLAILAQLVLVAFQVKNDQDVRMIRVWTVTAVTPVARIVEALRGGSSGFIRNYVLLHDAHEENRRLQGEVGSLKLENNYLKNEMNTADRAKALAVFQSRTPSKTVAAGTNSKVVFVDRGTVSGVERGMAVVTPDGIVGKVITAYPTASAVLLITDPDFAAGVVSQKGQVHGTLKGQGTPMCRVDYVPFEEKVEPGEWFYTSGDDRIFPRGFPVGVVKAVRGGQPFKEILVEPSAMEHGLEDVLILVAGVHEPIPDTPPVNQPVFIGSPPPAETMKPANNPGNAPPGAPAGTEADKLRAQYKDIGAAQGHKFGEGTPGSKPPDFNLKLPGPVGTPAAPAVPPGGASHP